MYNIQLEKGRGGEIVLNLYPSNGYYVQTVDGLTGVTSSFRTVQNINGAGDSIVGSTTEPKTLTIKGLILDGNTTAKQNLLDFCKPMAALSVNVMTDDNGTLTRYRCAKCFVKTSPIITQEKHSQFVLTLTMPMPYWTTYGYTEHALTVGASANNSITVVGDIEPSYRLTFKATGDCYGLTLKASPSTYALASAPYLYFDATKLAAGKLVSGDSVVFERVDGRIKLSVNTSTDGIAMVYTQSRLWYLPLGTNKYYIVGNNLSNCKLRYMPCYSGVLVDGV